MFLFLLFHHLLTFGIPREALIHGSSIGRVAEKWRTTGECYDAMERIGAYSQRIWVRVLSLPLITFVSLGGHLIYYPFSFLICLKIKTEKKMRQKGRGRDAVLA